MLRDLESILVDLPEDILRARDAGDFKLALRLINRSLRRPYLYPVLKDKLVFEKEYISKLPQKYPYTMEEAVEVARQTIPRFALKDLENYLESGLLDWIYINGKPHLAKDFFQKLCMSQPNFAQKAKCELSEQKAERSLLNKNITRILKEKGSTTMHCRIVCQLKINDSAFRSGSKMNVVLPCPAPSLTNRNIKTKVLSPSIGFKSYMDTSGASISFRGRSDKNQPFIVEYIFDTCVDYTNLDTDPVTEDQVTGVQGRFCINPLVTPHFELLQRSLVGNLKNPADIIQSFYDYCTTRQSLSHMQEYFSHSMVPNSSGLPYHGDGGIATKLFAALCRSAGYTARVQEGLSITPYSQAFHNWALLYFPNHDWIHVDILSGRDANQRRNQRQRKFYLGNLDNFKISISPEYQVEYLVPAKRPPNAPSPKPGSGTEYQAIPLHWTNYKTSWELLEYSFDE